MNQESRIEHQERGDVAVFMTLIMLGIMVASSLLLSAILARQLRATQDALDSERAFYATNAGLEAALYEVSQRYQTDASVSGAIAYTGSESGEAGYAAEAQTMGGGTCFKAFGNFRQERRKIAVGPAECP